MLFRFQGSHFLQDKVNRPGFAKFFLESASEERQHALKLMEYLLMRGELTTHDEFNKIIDSPVSALADVTQPNKFALRKIYLTAVKLFLY